MITYYSHDGSPLHPDDDTNRCFVSIEDYEDAIFDLEQLRKAVQATAEECAKIVYSMDNIGAKNGT